MCAADPPPPPPPHRPARPLPDRPWVVAGGSCCHYRWEPGGGMSGRRAAVCRRVRVTCVARDCRGSSKLGSHHFLPTAVLASSPQVFGCLHSMSDRPPHSQLTIGDPSGGIFGIQRPPAFGCWTGGATNRVVGETSSNRP